MALSNSQYDAIMREYGNSRWKTSTVRKRGKKRSIKKVPAVKELEAEIAERIRCLCQKLLEGNQEAIYELREKAWQI